MKLCVSSDIHSRNRDGSPVAFGETLIFLKRAGFEEIDLNITAASMLQGSWLASFRSKLKDAEAAGIRIRYAHLPYDYPNKSNSYSQEDFFTASCRAMDMAILAGADCAAIHPRTFMKQAYDAEAEHAEALRFLTPYRDYAQRAGLTLALENMRGPGQSAPKEIRRYGMQVSEVIRLADELEIGICWDTGHANISGQVQSESLQLIGSRLKMVHLNDNWAEDDIHLAPFLGNIDWQDVVKGLKAIGYSGSLNLEVGCNRFANRLRTAYAAYMAESARTLLEMLADTSDD